MSDTNPSLPADALEEPVMAPVVDESSSDEMGGGQQLDPVAQAAVEVAQWKDVALRAAAELENYRKRMAREMQDAVRFANGGLLESLLPVLDNFDYGLQAAKAENEGSTLFVGFSMVLKQMQDFLKDQGVEEISASVPFDPNLHEAMSQVPHETVPEGGIVTMVRRGYKLRDRLLRPASVILSSGPSTQV